MRALMRDCTVCVREKTTSFVLSLCCFVPPLRGNTAIKGTKSAGEQVQPRGSQLCRECWMCIKSLHSLLHSHTVVLYRTVCIVDKICKFFSLKRIVNPNSLSFSVGSIATNQEHQIVLSFCHYSCVCHRLWVFFIMSVYCVSIA